MGLFSTISTLFRPTAQSSGDTSSSLVTPADWLRTALFGRATATSALFLTPALSLTLATYYACIRNISEDVGKLPLFTYRRQSEDNKQRARSHPAYALLHDAPNEDMTAMTFRQLLTQHVLGWGNGYARIERETQPFRRPRSQVVKLWPIHPSKVTIRGLDSGEIVYDVVEHSELRRVRQQDMLHILGYTNDGLEGVSILMYAAESLGVSLAVQNYAGSFFDNSAVPSVLLKHPKQLSKAGQDAIRQSWLDLFKGPEKAQGVAVLEEGMDAQILTIPNEQAQFLQTREFQVTEICRWFRMPPDKVQYLKDAHYNSLEHQNLDYYTCTLLPWLVRWEQELKAKVFFDDPEHFAEHSVNALLRGDSTARARFYKEMFAIGALSPNDVRRYENENSIGPEGDQYFVAANNYQPLDAVIRKANQPAPAPGAPGPPPPPNGPRNRNGTPPVPANGVHNGAAH